MRRVEQGKERGGRRQHREEMGRGQRGEQEGAAESRQASSHPDRVIFNNRDPSVQGQGFYSDRLGFLFILSNKKVENSLFPCNKGRSLICTQNEQVVLH